MSRGLTKFSASWLTHVDVNTQSLHEWCRRRHDDFHAYCRFGDYLELQLSMDIEMHTFHQHTEVHWLRIIPAIRCILEQCDATS